MPKVETTYELEHEDVAHIICDYFLRQYAVVVKPEELHFNLTEYRVNEGYSGPGPDQQARINRVWFTK